MQTRPALEARTNEEDLFNEGVEEILAEHRGDARKAIRALLAQISYLEMARNRVIELASFGYARGKLQ
jgi:hypothetical protein